MKIIRIHPQDNVAVALEDVAQGEALSVGGLSLTAAEEIRRLSSRLNRYIHSFRAMEAQSMAADSQEKRTASGCRIFSSAPLASSTPTSKMAAETASPAKYSIRPWP